MAGLLDFEDPQVQMGLSLLAAGSPRADGAGFGQRLFEGVQNATAMRRATAQEKMLELQMAAAQRKADMMNDWMQKVKDAQNPAYAALQQGAASGSVGPTVANAARIGTAPTGVIGKVPSEAIMADLAMNDGKNISDWMYKQGVPDMQVSNGYAYDKNNLQPGFLPGLNISSTGQASLTTVGKDGLPVVSAPSGAVSTYSGYKDAEENAKAKVDLVDVPDGRGGSYKVTRDQAIKLLGLPAAESTPSPDVSMVGRKPSAMDMEIIRRDIAKNGNPAPVVNFQGPAPQLGRTLSKAEEAGATKTAEMDATREGQNVDNAKRYGQMQEGISRAISLLEKGPTASGIGSAADSIANFFGKSTKGAELAAQLSTLSGWLTSNVPRMEGPQSDRDVMNYRIQAGMVGDSKIPVEQRLAAAKEVQRLQDKYASLNGYGAPQAESAPEGKSYKDFGYKSPEAVIRDAQNKILLNPAARPEIIRRLNAMGLSLPGTSATGGW